MKKGEESLLMGLVGNHKLIETEKRLVVARVSLEQVSEVV